MGKTSYLVNGKPDPSGEILASLQSVFALDNGIDSDQTAFGPTKPLALTAKLGGPESTWELGDGTAAAVRFTGGAMGDAATVSGHWILSDIMGDDEIPVAVLGGTFTLKNLRVPFYSDVTVMKSGTGTVRLRGQIPALHKGNSTLSVTKFFTFEGNHPGADGGTPTDRMELDDELETIITYH